MISINVMQQVDLHIPMLKDVQASHRTTNRKQNHLHVYLHACKHNKKVYIKVDSK